MLGIISNAFLLSVEATIKMTQIARTMLPLEANFHVALARVFGIGRSSALQISESCGISKDMKVNGGSMVHEGENAQFITGLLHFYMHACMHAAKHSITGMQIESKTVYCMIYLFPFCVTYR